MVLQYASQIKIFGLNPGLIPTDIRKPLTGWFSGILEWFIGLFTPSAESYGRSFAELLLSDDLVNAASGMLLDQSLRQIVGSELCTADNAKKFIEDSQQLIQKATKK